MFAELGKVLASAALGFQIRLKVVDSVTGEEILPVFWDDNYFELFPGESRELRATYARPAAQPRIEVEGWNVPTS